MNDVLAIVLPVFGLIAIGFGAGRSGYVSPAAARGLPEFMFKVAMPALLFRTLGTATLPDAAPLSILVAYFGASALTWGLATVLARTLLRRPPEDAPALAFASSFSNAVMMGIPLCLSFFGDKSAPVLALIVACDVAFLWTAAALQLAWAQSRGPQTGDRTGRVSLRGVLGGVALRLATNPIIVSCAAGLAWHAGGLTLPPVLDRIISLLGQAGIPGALCALGLTLATFELKGQFPTVVLITLLKLLVMPAIAFLLATHALGLDATTAGIITVVAALPVGANAFLFASVHDRAAASVSGAVTLSLVLSVATVAGLLLALGSPR